LEFLLHIPFAAKGYTFSGCVQGHVGFDFGGRLVQPQFRQEFGADQKL
jgi:hypothetical protein